MPLPIAKYHADWLSLIEISGPFISIPVLTDAFPQGLEDVPAELARSLQADFEFWQENSSDPAVHSAWVRLVLETLLGYGKEVLISGQAIPAGLKAEFPEHEETLRPDFILAGPSDASKERKPRLLIQVFPTNQSLDNSVHGSRWVASVGTRMMELLHATEIRLGLVTNGEQWMLVDAPRGETTGFTTWYASLWFDERSTLNAFQSLLGVRRFFGVAEDETLENLLARSADHQWEITDQLGLQVRHAVEILIQSLDRADQNRGRKLLGAEVSPDLLYEAALTMMMRLVFMLSAEERKLLPIDDDQYSNYYAVSTLREQLQTQASQNGEEVLERRFDAWSRLLAVFRAVYGGIHHQDLHLPAYGGSLFDPDKYPFLEGRTPGTNYQETPANPLPIDNRTVLHLLDALQTLRADGEMRRLSFRALDVEQIGHVYEGLLDHHAVRTSEIVLGLTGTKKLEPEITLSKLEERRARSEESLLELLKDETQKSLPALRNALASNIQEDALKMGKLRSACGNDDALLARVLPFAGLIRMDDFENPEVILPGSVYVTAGTTRRATGTHYTPRSLTEPIVQHTLEPLVYEGVAEGLPRERWRLGSPAELLDLKICDMAMGSAGFLVQVVRYLAERLIESWTLENGHSATNDSLLSAFKRLSSDEDRLNYARRLVAERCIYGVDKNPLAVEIAKLSLWLVTLAKERPFTFLDHALKCGDSLVGASDDDFLRWARGYKDSAMTLFDEQLSLQLKTARGKRRELEDFVVRDVQDAERKQALLKEADAAMEHVKRGADLLTGARLLGLKPDELESLQNTLMVAYMAGELDGAIDPSKHYDADHALNAVKKEHVFHWEFEFPEVFEHGGFSAFVGNPPFLGGLRISTNYGKNYLQYLRENYPSSTGTADLCSFFFLRCFGRIKTKGTFGLIATNTISQGDTRQTGLDEIVKQNGKIYYANASTPWPSSAAVSVSVVYIVKGGFNGKLNLDGKFVDDISAMLDSSEKLENAFKLKTNSDKSYIGSYVLGLGFVMEPGEAQKLIEKDKRNADVLFPYLIGDDLASSPDQSPSRWVINFFDWTQEQAKSYKDCFTIVKEKVYPQRMQQNRESRKKYWWRYGEIAPGAYRAIKRLERTIAIAQTSKYLTVSFQPTNIVFSHMTVIIASNENSIFALLNSYFHESWVRKYASTLETRLRYIPSDCFETFPFPMNLKGLEGVGERYYNHRCQIMLSHQEGLTTTFNRFHNPGESAEDIVRLRELHLEMDKAVASAYGWSDMDLGLNFHETTQGVRFTISESARREVLSRLLKLNHERHEEEMKNAELGMHKKGQKREKNVRKSKSADDGQMGMF